MQRAMEDAQEAIMALRCGTVTAASKGIDARHHLICEIYESGDSKDLSEAIRLLCELQCLLRALEGNEVTQVMCARGHKSHAAARHMLDHVEDDPEVDEDDLIDSSMPGVLYTPMVNGDYWDWLRESVLATFSNMACDLAKTPINLAIAAMEKAQTRPTTDAGDPLVALNHARDAFNTRGQP